MIALSLMTSCLPMTDLHYDLDVNHYDNQPLGWFFYYFSLPVIFTLCPIKIGLALAMTVLSFNFLKKHKPIELLVIK